jgi:hypothetical protein
LEVSESHEDAAIRISEAVMARLDERTRRADLEWPNHLASELFRMPTGEAEYKYTFATTVTPDPIHLRAILGVFVWRMLGELQAPLLRRHANGPMWRRALQANQGEALGYLMGVDQDGAPTAEVTP